MKESFDQHDGQSPWPSTGSRQAAHSRGKARSSAARSIARTAPAPRFSRVVEAMPANSLNMSAMTPRYRSIMDLSLFTFGLCVASLFLRHVRQLDDGRDPDIAEPADFRSRAVARAPTTGGFTGAGDVSPRPRRRRSRRAAWRGAAAVRSGARSR